MGNYFGFGGDAGDDEEEEAKQLDSWRPQSEAGLAGLRKKRDKDKASSESSHDESGQSESQDGASSEASQEDSIAGDSVEGESEGKAESDAAGSEKGSEGDSDADSEEGKQADMMQKQRDAKRKKKIVVRMDFEPLLSLHEPLSVIVEEPANLFAHRKRKKTGKQGAAQQAAIDDAQNANRRKAKMAAEWLIDMGLDDCLLKELAQSIGEDPDELKYAIIQSNRFTVDEDGVVKRTMLQKIFDVMESDVETFREVLEKLVLELQEEEDIVENQMRDAIRGSMQELRLKMAQDVELLEHVDLEAEAADARQEEKEARSKEKEAKARKRGDAAQQEEESSSDDDGDFSMNKEAERRALAFRRVQVQKKIEDFLRLYTKGQNLIKISKGKKYHRRVYIDTVKKSLVIQGATGPKLYAFAKMKDVDMDVRTTPEGRVENLVVCAIENSGRITKELTLCFPDHAKANQFVNCITLFSAALRPQRGQK